MSTAKQVQANRENTKKSTGPKTPEGKAKVSQNAVTHGLTSKRPVLDIEDTAEFRGFVNELLDQLDPTNPLEFVFAKHASCQAWRIQRAQSYETLILDKLIKGQSQTDKTKPKYCVFNRNTMVATKTKPISFGLMVSGLSTLDLKYETKPNSALSTMDPKNETNPKLGGNFNWVPCPRLFAWACIHVGAFTKLTEGKSDMAIADEPKHKPGT